MGLIVLVDAATVVLHKLFAGGVFVKHSPFLQVTYNVCGLTLLHLFAGLFLAERKSITKTMNNHPPRKIPAIYELPGHYPLFKQLV